MKKETHYNLNKIVSINLIVDNKLNYTYIPEIKIFGYTIIKEHWERPVFENIYGDNIPNKFYRVDYELYEKPFIIVNYPNDFKRVNFETEENARKYIEYLKECAGNNFEVVE